MIHLHSCLRAPINSLSPVSGPTFASDHFCVFPERQGMGRASRALAECLALALQECYTLSDIRMPKLAKWRQSALKDIWSREGNWVTSWNRNHLNQQERRSKEKDEVSRVGMAHLINSSMVCNPWFSVKSAQSYICLRIFSTWEVI